MSQVNVNFIVVACTFPKLLSDKFVISCVIFKLCSQTLLNTFAIFTGTITAVDIPVAEIMEARAVSQISFTEALNIVDYSTSSKFIS